ncbi:MAG: phenylalanine--tRNA ligase subunit beta [Candidatus Muiribacterium halophilum]|uniref:Phenylalanine--tRNA ligase beta subunit n=1 Tax=Muiribacterium halophilum TaxID=2053465 RepID=A0A2N5ZGI0_MUIH1|nr:MAG: phenylalanine--tRNA ligase subunit beta [Candidatus Muirbacterium halophilum]
MKLTYNWLKEFIDIPVSPLELKDIFPKIGLEVDDFQYMGKSLEEVVVGKIESIRKHPDADKLSLCMVNDSENTNQIVCGAKNMKEGDSVVLAKVGANLPNGIKIKKAKLRGEESFGMLCSLQELGLADKSDGIMILPACAPVGEHFRDYYGLDDYMYSLETFANRPDHMGVIGIARDLSVYFNTKLKVKEIPYLNSKPSKEFEIKIENSEDCPRYIGRYVKNVSKTDSPEYIKNRLVACGMRPIDFLVDVTNYVMLETGHPMHAFDARYFPLKKVVIRKSEGEKFKALNEKEYSLSKDDIVIANEKETVAIAGIIGGQESEIKDDNKEIFLESAMFDHKRIQSTSRKISLKTDSSQRFEKDADINMAMYAMKMASYLINKYIPEAEFYEIIDSYSKEHQGVYVDFDIEKVNSYLGVKVEKQELESIISRLPIKEVSQNRYEVESCRKDLNIPVDIIEEIAKFYGYDKISKKSMIMEMLPYYNQMENMFVLTDKMVAMGFYEIKNLSLTSEKQDDNVIESINPLNEDMRYLRQNMYKNMLNTIEYNAKRGVEDHAYFENGRTYLKNENEYKEKKVIAIAVSGSAFLDPGDKIPYSYLYLKGIIERLLSGYELEFVSEDLPEYLHPGIAAKIRCSGKNIGVIGKIHPSLGSKYYSDVYYAEIYPEAFPAKKNIVVGTVSRFPDVKFDLSLLVPEGVESAVIIDTIKALNIKEISDVHLYDEYIGENIPEGKYSLTYRLLFSHPDKTLDDKQINKTIDSILKNLNEKGIGLR